MDDTMNRLAELLSDDESLKQLSELAQMIRSGETEEQSSQPEDCEMPDISMIAGIAGLAGAMNGPDSNTELLMALRPHLGAEKQQRLDKAVKLLRIAAVVGAAKESGLLDKL